MPPYTVAGVPHETPNEWDVRDAASLPAALTERLAMIREGRFRAVYIHQRYQDVRGTDERGHSRERTRYRVLHRYTHCANPAENNGDMTEAERGQLRRESHQRELAKLEKKAAALRALLA